ncbi:hypothetical protein [Burkholderia sp. Nafp2/4-1b]|uniref:hypothetical protein n=1 Tax=Burkholderia sp. Nafp2/4-1b TaxID=2116686 RepID=UPI0013CE9046|nr:hypothetical protein [Burkholderia sp. Nafp2/4-1b]
MKRRVNAKMRRESGALSSQIGVRRGRSIADFFAFGACPLRTTQLSVFVRVASTQDA